MSAVALLSLGIKAIAIQGAPAPNDEESRRRLSGFLTSQGFTPAAVPPMAGIGLVGGTRGDCRLILAGMSLQGWQDDVLGQVRSPGDAIAFVMDGEAFEAAPRWRARLAYYGDKVRRGMGLAPSGTSLTGVISSPACGTRPADWSVL